MKEILQKQFDYAKSQGWIPFFEEAAKQFNFDVADLMAIASRESNLRNIKGDFHSGEYHGYSLMQLDINSHREWIESGAWEDVEQAINRGAQALADKRSEILATSKKASARIRFRSGKTDTFTPRSFTPAEFRQIYLAAYNCGIASYYHFSIGNDIDRGTTQHNYGRDVILRAYHFAEFLKDEDPPTAAPLSAARPAESVKQQEEVEKEDLFDVATSSDSARVAGKSVGKRLLLHGTAGVTWLEAMWEAHKIGAFIVMLVVLVGIGWLIYHNRARLRTLALKLLK